MNTPSHFLMSVALRRYFKFQTARPSAVWLGSVAPDISLYAFTFGAFFYYTQFKDWESRETFYYIFDYLYFNDPVWILFHNLLHAPISVGILYGFNHFFRSVYPKLSMWIRWFLMTCMLHAAVDIVTHFDDGPLILFPFEWSVRFYSPISYWDPQHFGREFSYVEMGLNIMLILYLLQPVLRWVAAKKVNVLHNK